MRSPAMKGQAALCCRCTLRMRATADLFVTIEN